MEQKWKRIEADGYTIIDNGDGRTLGIAKDSPVPILTVDGYAFKDFLRTGELAPYEDWRLSSEERARDLAQRLSMEDIAGLMLYSPHQLIPARGRWRRLSAAPTAGNPMRRAARSPGS